MENIIWVVLLCAVLALLFAAWKTSVVSKADAGTERMKEIAGNISDGARAFLFAEYKILVIFVAVLFVLIGVGIGNWVRPVHHLAHRWLLPDRRGLLCVRRLCGYERGYQGQCPYRCRR